MKKPKTFRLRTSRWMRKKKALRRKAKRRMKRMIFCPSCRRHRQPSNMTVFKGQPRCASCVERIKAADEARQTRRNQRNAKAAGNQPE